MTMTVSIALRPAKPTPSQSPQVLRWKISTPVRICASPMSSQNQPQAVRSIPYSTSLAWEAIVSSSDSAAIPLRRL